MRMMNTVANFFLVKIIRHHDGSFTWPLPSIKFSTILMVYGPMRSSYRSGENFEPRIFLINREPYRIRRLNKFVPRSVLGHGLSKPSRNKLGGIISAAKNKWHTRSGAGKDSFVRRASKSVSQVEVLESEYHDRPQYSLSKRQVWRLKRWCYRYCFKVDNSVFFAWDIMCRGHVHYFNAMRHWLARACTIVQQFFNRGIPPRLRHLFTVFTSCGACLDHFRNMQIHVDDEFRLTSSHKSWLVFSIFYANMFPNPPSILQCSIQSIISIRAAEVKFPSLL